MPVNTVSDEYGPCFDLLCAEDAGALLAGDDHDGLAEYRTGPELFPDDSDESIAEFLEGESDYSPGFDYPARFRSKSLDPFARQESVAWILKVHAFYRFQPLTAYLAVNYFDRFLSAHHLPEAKVWALQLLSVACLSLAAKMEETFVPTLLDLQVEGARFIFEPRTVCKMELLVLTALKWRLRSITPFTFIDFFAYKADPSGTYTRYLVAHATRIILATIHDFEFLDHCPSSMAAAAIICAAGDQTPDLALVNAGSAITWCIGLTKEGITNCYHLLQEAVTVIDSKQRMPSTILPHMRVTTSSNASSDGASSSSSTSFPPNKRRKLVSNKYCVWVDDDKAERERDDGTAAIYTNEWGGNKGGD